MSLPKIIQQFKEKVCREVELEPVGIGRYVVYTPFMFDDGDHYVVVLKREADRWVLTDEGHTFMHLSYDDIDLSKGTRGQIVDDALRRNHVENRAGELRHEIPDESFGDSLFSFVQGIGRITSAALWTRERVKSTFIDDFRSLIESVVPAPKKKRKRFGNC